MIEVDETCAPKIHSLFKGCEDGCKTIQDKIKFIFVHVAIQDWKDDEYEIVRDYISFISQGVDESGTEKNMQTPHKFCAKKINLKACSDEDCGKFFGDEPLELFKQKNKVRNYYYDFSIDRISKISDGLKMYVEHVLESIQFQNDFKGPHVPEEFCEMKQCSNDIRSDIPNIDVDDGRIYPHIIGNSIWVNVVYENLRNNSKGYVDQFFNAINVEDTINENWNIATYCAEYFDEVNEMMTEKDDYTLENDDGLKRKWESDCQSFFQTCNFNMTDNKANLKHIFYNFSKTNITPLKVDGREFNVIYSYMTFVIQYLSYDGKNIKAAPEQYCIAVMENKKKNSLSHEN